MNGIKYNIEVGSPCSGWAEGEHVEPGVSVYNPDESQNNALSLLSCIGNEATVKSGDAKGVKGIVTGKHGPVHVHFKRRDKENLTIGDLVQIKTWGVGLKIKGYEGVNIHKCGPNLVEALGIDEKGGELIVPVVAEFPAELMGSGIGMSPHSVDYDIQSTCPEVVDEYGINRLRIGDIVALRDQLNDYGRGYYKGAISIGVIIHGWSHHSGHGPGVTTIMSTKYRTLKTRLDQDSNIIKVLNIT